MQKQNFRIRSLGLQFAIVNGRNYTAVNNSEVRDSLKENYAAVDLLH